MQKRTFYIYVHVYSIAKKVQLNPSLDGYKKVRWESNMTPSQPEYTKIPPETVDTLSFL